MNMNSKNLATSGEYRDLRRMILEQVQEVIEDLVAKESQRGQFEVNIFQALEEEEAAILRDGTFSDWLKYSLRYRGWTERVLADKANVPYGTLHGYISGAATKTGPSFRYVARLVKTLGGSLDEIMKLKDLQ